MTCPSTDPVTSTFFPPVNWSFAAESLNFPVDSIDACMALTDTKVPESSRLRRVLDGEGDEVDPSKGSEGGIGESGSDDSSSDSESVGGSDDRRLDGNSFNVLIMLASTAALSGWLTKSLMGLGRFDFVRSRNMR